MLRPAIVNPSCICTTMKTEPKNTNGTNAHSNNPECSLVQAGGVTATSKHPLAASTTASCCGVLHVLRPAVKALISKRERFSYMNRTEEHKSEQERRGR